MNDSAPQPRPQPGSYAESYYDDYVLNMTEENKPRTLQRISAVLDMLGPQRGRLLTVGAGNLVEPLAYKEAGFDVTIADVATTQFDRARRNGIKTHQLDLDRDELPQRYDVISCLEVLEHLVDPLAAARRLACGLSDEGRLFISLPDEFHLYSRLRMLGGRPIFAHHDWPHLRLFNLDAARELFRAAGLEEVNVRHMPLVPPRMKRLAPLGRAMCRLLPGLMSISHVFELRPADR